MHRFEMCVCLWVYLFESTTQSVVEDSTGIYCTSMSYHENDDSPDNNLDGSPGMGELEQTKKVALWILKLEERWKLTQVHVCMSE